MSNSQRYAAKIVRSKSLNKERNKRTIMMEWLTPNSPSDCEIDLVIQREECQRSPWWGSVCSDAAIVPGSLIMNSILQDDVVHLDHVCVLFKLKDISKHRTRWGAPDIYLMSKLIGSTVYADDEISSIHFVTTWHLHVKRLFALCIRARWGITAARGMATARWIARWKARKRVLGTFHLSNINQVDSCSPYGWDTHNFAASWRGSLSRKR